MNEPIKPPRLADAIAERLQAMVLEGVLRPGERLLGERELAAKLKVSRPSLRDALAALERKGLIVTAKTGSTVANFLEPLADPLAELFRDDARVADDYFEFRRVMETEASVLAARRATDLDRRLIRERLEDMRAAHEDEDPAREAEADVQLHVAIYEASHNVVVLHMLRALADLMRKGVFFNRDAFYRRAGVRDLLLEQHLKIGEAVVSGDAKAAQAAASAHIKFIAATLDELRRDELRQAAALRRFERSDIVAGS
jgi:GntR family transcriptional repressor for pyruvate dehydrogenase complex